MLEVSKCLFEFFNSGKKIKDGNTIKEANEKIKDNRPPWRGTGAGQAM